MKLNQLVSKPQLTKVVLDDEEIVKEYGESIEFYTWDRQPLDVFLRLANSSSVDVGNMIGIVKTLILDEKGVEIINNEQMLPAPVLIKAIAKIVESLGK
jgi:hypothetical protein